MDLQAIKKMAIKPAINGIVGAMAIEMITVPGEKLFKFYGVTYPIWSFGLVMGLVSSLSVEVISNAVLPHIPNNQKFKHLESLVLHVASSAGVFVAGARIVSNKLNMENARKFAITGIASEAVSSFIYEAIAEDNVLNF